MKHENTREPKGSVRHQKYSENNLTGFEWPSGRCVLERWPNAGRTLAGRWPGTGRTLAGHWPDAGRTLAGHFRMPRQAQTRSTAGLGFGRGSTHRRSNNSARFFMLVRFNPSLRTASLKGDATALRSS